MRTDHYFDSCGEGKIHYCRWTPDASPRGVVQIVHGIAEYAARYDEFARYLNGLGYLVVAEDHMGHGGSISENTTQGYFDGGWFNAVADTYQLLSRTKSEFPELPYVLFGHSMGSFMARTILAKYPDSGITAAVICGTGWMNPAVINAGIATGKLLCRLEGERNPSKKMHAIAFGSYNAKVEHPRTPSDWLNRNSRCVDEYIADPLCGFIASAGLMRDMLTGISYIQTKNALASMRKDLPVFFIAGGDDPVGEYGKGVHRAAEEFRKAGMEQVDVKIYPLCRHEILNEINKREIHRDVARWMSKYTGISEET